jgi:DNA mismatch repair protein MSH5
VRLAKDFAAAKGRDRLLSLKLFANLSQLEEDGANNAEEHMPPTNAYDFMRGRHVSRRTDPTLLRWQAIIRLGGYTAVEYIPICVSMHMLFMFPAQ